MAGCTWIRGGPPATGCGVCRKHPTRLSAASRASPRCGLQTAVARPLIMIPCLVAGARHGSRGQTGGNMRRAIPAALLAGAVIASAAAIGIGAAVVAAPQTMGRHEYEAAMRGVDAARDGIFNRCEALS